MMLTQMGALLAKQIQDIKQQGQIQHNGLNNKDNNNKIIHKIPSKVGPITM